MINLLRNTYIRVDWCQLHLRKMLSVSSSVENADWIFNENSLRLIATISGTTKVKMAGGQTEQEGKLPEFVERRRAALERYLIRTANHPIFQVDPDFREFLECGIFKIFPYFYVLLRYLTIHLALDRRGITSCIEYLCTQRCRCVAAF